MNINAEGDKNMNKVFNYVSGWGENIEIVKNNGELSHIYWSFEDKYYLAVMPHKGNDFRYMLRINLKTTFDRWSNAEEEYFFDNVEDMISYMIEHV